MPGFVCTIRFLHASVCCNVSINFVECFTSIFPLLFLTCLSNCSLTFPSLAFHFIPFRPFPVLSFLFNPFISLLRPSSSTHTAFPSFFTFQTIVSIKLSRVSSLAPYDSCIRMFVLMYQLTPWNKPSAVLLLQRANQMQELYL